MIEKLFVIEAEENSPDCRVPPNAPATAGYFSHINECTVCSYSSHGLCEVGEALLDTAAGIGNGSPQ